VQNTLLCAPKDKQITLGVAGFIANRIAFNSSKKAGDKRSFSRFIIRLSMAATIISVAVMIITLAFVNGFQEQVSQKVFGFLGHIRIQEKQPFKSLIAEDAPIYQDDSLVNLVRQNPEVQYIYSIATKNSMIKMGSEIEGVMFKGYDSTFDFNHLKRFLKEGRPLDFKYTDTATRYSREVIISEYTARQLKVKLNDRPFIYFILPDGEVKTNRLTIVGIYKTGIEEYDKNFILGDIRLIRWLNKWDSDLIGAYEIFLRDYTRIDEMTDSIYNIESFPPTWDTQSIRATSPNIFDWLHMQDLTRNVLIGIMLGVALINLVTCLLILVLERLRMIGTLKALGATDWTVQKIFLRHSLLITLSGILAGTALALGILYLQVKTGFLKLKEEAYYLSEAAVKITWWEVAIIAGGALIVCFLILMIPSILVRRISPVKAIQFR
jgi:lipoprotein-releasing system permease protein